MAVVERGALIWNIYPFTSKYMGNLPFYFKGHEAVPVLVNFRDVVTKNIEKSIVFSKYIGI